MDERLQDLVSPQLQLQDLAATATLFAAPQLPASPRLDPFEGAGSGTTSSSPIEDDDDESVSDGRRNWSHDVTLRLVSIWKRVCQEKPEIGRVARMGLVYEELKDAVDCSHRSRKAVEDKLYTLKQMYHFVMKMNGNLNKPVNRSGTPTWFELTKEERRAVRSLHRVRVPNISLEVFHVIDSVLNPNPLCNVPGERPASAAGSSVSSEIGESISDERAESSEIVDNKRNWSDDVTLQLAKAWHSAHISGPQLRGAMLSQRVYSEFIKAVGSCSRSRKAVDDKMHSMKEMYRFIRLHDTKCVPGSSGHQSWFELTKADRRHLRAQHKIRVPNMPQAVYAELDQFLKQQADVSELHSRASSPAGGVSGESLVQSRFRQVSASGVADYGSQTIAMIRRLAEEESDLSPIPLVGPQSEESHGTTEPASKRPRTTPSAESEPPLNAHLHLQRLMMLQERAILERREQHAQQMALLRTILLHLEGRQV